MHQKKPWFRIAFVLPLLLALATGGHAQKFEAPETVLTDSLLKALLNEVSGQLAFNNEVATAGFVRLRTQAEFDGLLHEAEYLSGKLKEYGVDDVVVESLNKDDKTRTWWVGQEAELWIKSPEERRLSRLEEHPALMTRGCDSGEWEGEVVFLDRRDVFKLEEMDLKGKIVLTPEYAGFFSRAFAKGLLGVISY